VYKKPKIIPSKANKEFLSHIDNLKNNLEKDDKIYYLDGCHPQHNPIVSNGWIKKGKCVELKTNTGRKRLNLNGALNMNDVTDVIALSEDTISSDETIKLLTEILKINEFGDIYLIADNTKYYKSKK